MATKNTPEPVWRWWKRTRDDECPDECLICGRTGIVRTPSLKQPPALVPRIHRVRVYNKKGDLSEETRATEDDDPPQRVPAWSFPSAHSVEPLPWARTRLRLRSPVASRGDLWPAACGGKEAAPTEECFFSPNRPTMRERISLKCLFRPTLQLFSSPALSSLPLFISLWGRWKQTLAVNLLHTHTFSCACVLIDFLFRIASK